MCSFKKFPPLVLAAVLQLMPICRAVYTFEALPGCGFAILARWAVGGIAIFGYHAVSSASNLINSPTTATGTVGTTFTYRITTTDGYSDQRYTASPVPAGVTPLSVSTSSFVTGTPTTPGVTKMTVTVSASGYNSIQQVVTVTINAATPPTFTSQPVNSTNTVGTTASFSAGVSGATGYQWYFNSSVVTNATGTTLTITNVQPANVGSYYLMASNAIGATNSASATLTVGYPPVISTQPQSQISNQGSNVTFNVGLVPGSSNLVYRWLNGTNLISGATNASYQITNAQWFNAGSYSVIITNLFGVATSSNASLTVAGDFVFADRGTSLSCPFFGPEPTNLYTSKTGNTSTGLPAGSQVYGGVRLVGTNYTAQLWGALGANLPESALAPIPGATTNFMGLPGFLATVPLNPVVPGAVEGSVATMELRIWNNQTNTVTNWSQVLANTNVDRGVSPIFNSPPLGGVSPAPPLTGLLSFNTYLPSPNATVTPTNNLTLSAKATGRQIFLTFNATIGQAYLIQYGVLDGNWLPLTTLTATVTNPVVMDLATNFMRLYRVTASTNFNTGPAPAIQLAGQQQGGQFLLSFNSVLGHRYTVEYKNTNGPWQPLTIFNATGTNSVLADVVTNLPRYYRVVTSWP